MTHQLTIDQTHCRGLSLCHACEAIKPGLALHVERHGRLLVSGPATAENGSTLSRLVACCPDRAIMIQPVEEHYQ